MLRVGVIGLGDIALIHVPLIQKSKKAQLVAVCDIDEEKRTFVKEVPFYTDYKEMVEEENLDIVHVCLPHYMHYTVTKYLAQKNIHVLQEKPVTLDYKEALKAIEVEKNSTSKIAICFQNRKNKTFVELLRIINSGKYGEIEGIKGLVSWARPKTYYDVKPWRGTWQEAGGGTMINQSIHTLDLMQLIGGKISTIKASTTQLLDYGIEVEDTVVANITFENELRGFFMSTNANIRNDSVELKVYLKHAELVVRNSKLYLITENCDEEIITEDEILEGSKSYYGASHQTIFEEFYDAIIADNENYVTVADAAIAIRMVDAIHKSSNENRIIRMEEVI